MDHQRRLTADQALAQFDFHLSVKDTGPWQEQGDDGWSRLVFLEGPGDETSTRQTFVVSFRPGTAEVADAYLAG
jgi:hypothetical protein